MKDTPLWHYRWILLPGLAAVMYLLAICTGYDPSISSRSVLGALARVQAAIFAIVFSIVILGVQLSASRYSPRLASTFKSDPGYRWMVGIFGFSIGLNILGLYLIGSIPEEVLLAIVLVSGVLAIGAFWTLYDFVNSTLEKTTPEGILKEIKSNLVPKSIVNDAHKASEDAANRDPFLILVNVILSTISERDQASASHGLSILEDRVTALLRETSAEEFEEETPVDQSVEDLCTDRIPNIAEEAVDEDSMQTAVEAVETSEAIGEEAAKEDLDRIVEHVVSGQSGLVADLGYGVSDERVRREAMDIASNVLKEAVDHGVWQGSANGSRILGWLSAASIMDRRDEGYNRYYTSLLILCFPKLLSKVADSDEELEDHSASDWLRAYLIDDVDPVEELVASCYGSMAELTSAAIRYEIRTGEKILEWESVAAGWTEGFEALCSSNLESMAQIWLGTILYLEYIQEMSPDDVMDGFSPRAPSNVDSDLGLDTWNRVSEGDLEVRARIDFIPGRFDPTTNPMTGYRRPPIQDSDEDFEDWLSSQRIRLGMGGRVGMSEEDSSEE